MKRAVVCVMLLAAFVWVSQAVGQSPSGQGAPGQGPPPGGPPRFTPEAQLDRLAQQLNLTDDQKAKIKPILEDQAKQFQTLRDDTSVSPEDRRSQFMQIRENTSKKIRAVLDPDQQKKYDEMESSRGQFGGPRGGNRQPPPPPPQ